jgi:uncharacterized protein
VTEQRGSSEPVRRVRPTLGLRVLMLPIRSWRLVSVHLPPRCRFQPSCSQYALEALAMHGAIRGSALALRRLTRCHPWGGCGFDSVPPNTRSPSAAADMRLAGPETRAG